LKALALLWSRTLERTFATEEGDRACLLLESLDLDLPGECGRDGGSEIGLMFGRLDNGNKFPPGLADRDIRGQAISPSQTLYGQVHKQQQDLLSL
jgi:hypothetical protein